MNSPVELPVYPRRRWLAAGLSLLFGPLGQVYAGRMRRAVIWWMGEDVILPAIVLLVLIWLPSGQAAVLLAGVMIVGFRLALIADPWRLARKNQQAPLKAYQRWWVYIALLLIGAVANKGAALLHKSHIAEAFVMPTRNMSPTIRPGDRFLVDKLSLRRSPLKRGDIAIFYSEGRGSPLYAMRVAGLPGDEVEIKNERVLVNGVEWNDPHPVFEGEIIVDRLANMPPVAVPHDSFFVLGDNRRGANDSRFRGPIPIADLVGIARLIYWSQERVFPDPDDNSTYTLGRIHGDRIGQRLD